MRKTKDLRWLACARPAAATWLCVVIVVASGCRGGSREAGARSGESAAAPVAGAGTRPSGNREVFAGLTLVDATPGSGIDWKRTSGTPDKPLGIESPGGGAAWLDYDQDGNLDLYLVNGSTVDRFYAGKPGDPSRMFRGDGRGKFTEASVGAANLVPGGWGFGATVGDYDGDGWPDLFVTNLGPDRLYRNQGDGSFVDETDRAGVADPRMGASAAFGDIDGDGLLDLYIADYGLNSTDNKMQQPLACDWQTLKVGCGPPGITPDVDTLYRNQGDGTFRDVSEESGIRAMGARPSLGVVFLDYDDDGDQDIYVAVDMDASLLWQNNGRGHFDNVALLAGAALSASGATQAGMGIAIGDYDNDLDEDLLVTHFDMDYDTLYRNDGRRYTDISAAAGLVSATWAEVGWGAGFVDLDHDGDLDLVNMNGHAYPQVDRLPGHSYRQRALAFENNGGRFARADPARHPALALERVGRGGAFADHDNDGDVDFLIATSDEDAVLVRNDGGSRRGHWITVTLADSSPNRLALGARIRVQTGDAVQQRVVRGAYSYLSYNDDRSHFGLGAAATVDLIEVRWPDGALDRVAGPIAADRHLRIVRGAGRVESPALP